MLTEACVRRNGLERERLVVHGVSLHVGRLKLRASRQPNGGVTTTSREGNDNTGTFSSAVSLARLAGHQPGPQQTVTVTNRRRGAAYNPELLGGASSASPTRASPLGATKIGRRQGTELP